MENVSRNRNREEKGKSSDNRQSAEQIKIAGIIYGTRSLTDCMEHIIKLHIER